MRTGPEKSKYLPTEVTRQIDGIEITFSPEFQDKFWQKIDRTGECWIWKRGRFKSGYGKVGYGCKQLRSHRIAFALSNGNIPDGLNVLHTCDNPPCCNPAHLWLGTDKDNAADCTAKNRRNPLMGSDNPVSKLSESVVLKMRKYHTNDTSYAELGRRFGVSRDAARKAVIGITWKHVSPETKIPAISDGDSLGVVRPAPSG